MRIESSVTSISWIPSEAIPGIVRLPFQMGVTHYDPPPPDHLGDLSEMHRAGIFRFANRLEGWIEVEDGTIVRSGRSGEGYLSSTQVKVAGLAITLAPTKFPELRPDPEIGESSVSFVQTAGGRPGLPAPRFIEDSAIPHITPPTVWTTLQLTINADGASSGELAGASTFPRHWVYDNTGTLVKKSGLIDFDTWYRESWGAHTPWGGEDSSVATALAETALERELSMAIMATGAARHRRALAPGDTLVEEGDIGEEVFLLLDGIIEIETGGIRLCELGPGAVVGERAPLEGGRRTATIRALTPARVVSVDPDLLDWDALEELSRSRRHEE
jgi:hypothetical protein